MAILTGGGDRPYALGLAAALVNRQIAFDFIGSDEVGGAELPRSELVRFLNLRGDQTPHVSLPRKLWRVAMYYIRLLLYVPSSEAKIFHILWNNRWEHFDRTLLMLYYQLFAKRVVLTVHNVNKGKRDGHDTWLNRFTLRMQYRAADHLFVHTAPMKGQLQTEFGVPETKISVIPFGINNTVPNTSLTPTAARRALGISPGERTLLFFGNIAPYKGLEHLVEAVRLLSIAGERVHLIIAGRPKGAETYWETVQRRIADAGLARQILQKIEYVPDAETEIYFKAADVLLLPYTHIFQSGVLSLGYSFGLPVIATDVGSLRDDILEEETGFVVPPSDPAALANAIRRYFSSAMYLERDATGQRIREHAHERYSWSKVGALTAAVYAALTACALPHREKSEGVSTGRKNRGGASTGDPGASGYPLNQRH